MATPIHRYLTAARAAGCPRDQVENLLRAGVVLQPRQLAASALARSCDAPGGPTEVAYGGARGGGKSFWLLAQLADDCLRYAGLKCLVLRKVGGSGREGFEDLLPRVLSGVPYRYVPTGNLLVMPNGSRIKLGHYKDERDVDKYLGLEYDVIGVEEATTLTASKYRTIRTCNRTSKPGWRPRIYSTTNPGGVGHDWYKRRFIDPFTAGAEASTRFIPATIDDNRHVNAEYRGILDGLTGWQLRAWRHGDWDIASGQYFTAFGRAFHACPAFGAVPKYWRLWASLDYGFRHYTVAYLLGLWEGTVYLIDEHAERRWLPDQHAAAMDAMLARHGLTRDDLETTVAGGDCWKSESDGSTVADAYAEAGWDLSRADMRRVDGAFELTRRLGDPGHAARPRPATIRISEDCRGLLACLPAMVHSERNPEDVAKVDTDEDGAGGDDWYDSARYGVMYVAGGPRVSAGSTPIEDLAR